ncbi:unnamed protein product [Rhizophagus irregularis]|nr:unnamed protein product [Rhizophagus irregularis]
MPEILSLVEILRKYSEYLVTTDLHENYIQLNDALLEEPVYRYIDIQPYLPINIMKQYQFIKELQLTFPIGIYSKVSPAVLRMLYFDLTGDVSVTSNTNSRDVEERLRLMLRLADPAIVFDLRTNNGFNGTKFNVFWDELEAYFNEQNLLVTDE